MSAAKMIKNDARIQYVLKNRYLKSENKFFLFECLELLKTWFFSLALNSCQVLEQHFVKCKIKTIGKFVVKERFTVYHTSCNWPKKLKAFTSVNWTCMKKKTLAG